MNVKLLLLLPDISAAYDMVDHTIMLTRHRDHFGITATCFAWFDKHGIAWMGMNKLKLNTVKTYVVVICAPYIKNQFSMPYI